SHCLPARHHRDHSGSVRVLERQAGLTRNRVARAATPTNDKGSEVSDAVADRRRRMSIQPTRRATLQAAAASVLSSAWIRHARADETGTLTVALSNNRNRCEFGTPRQH